MADDMAQFGGSDVRSEQRAILNSLQQTSKIRIQEEKYVLRVLSDLSRGKNLEDEAVQLEIERELNKKLSEMRSKRIDMMSDREQAVARKNRVRELAEEKKSIAERNAVYIAGLEAEGASDDRIRKAREDARAEELEAERRLASEKTKLQAPPRSSTSSALDEYEKKYARSNTVKGKAQEIMTKARDEGALKGASSILSPLSKLPNQLKQTLENNVKITQEQADRSREELEELQEEYKNRIANGEDPESEEMKELLKRGQEAQLKATKDANKASAAAMANAIKDSITNEYKNAYKEATNILTQYKGKIDARMQGTDKDFKDLQNTISNNLALSPFVRTTKVLDKLAEAVDQGISYNVEQRAFLASVADKIASTFDAFDSNLLRLIRLQQADSTAARMGMEASLNKLFNSMFQDTSYLSNGYDQVSAAILDANSQLSRDASAEFEFVVQKWLGALSSLGMDTNTLTTIAQGINYLATGDVTNLSNNSSLQTMLAMAASNANLEYSEMLLNGMDADTTNKLLESMVVYLKDIAENSDSQVVKAAYGDIFSMSLSDLSAVSNITAEEISKLSEHNMTYDNMMSEMNSQLNQLVSRSSVAEMLDNVYNNVMFSVASDMASNPVTFMMQKMVDFMTDTGTDINIPFINAMGFGLDLNASVKDLLQMGLGIGQAFSLAGTLASALGGSFGTELGSPWKATETTQRGSGLNLSSMSTLGGVSGSLGTFAQSGNSEDTTNSTMSSATDDAEESKKITNKNSEPPEYNIEDLYKAIVGDSATSYVNIKDSTLMAAYDASLQSLRAYDPRLKVDDGRTKDGILMAAYDPSAQGIRTVDGRLSVEDGKIKVHDSGVISELDDIYTLLCDKTASVNTVSLAENTTVKVDQSDITQAMKVAMFGDSSESGMLLSEVLKTLKDGLLSVVVSSITDSVAVKNTTGEKLQVSNLIW